ncbi:unnamed protein product [Rhizoctonia solani]|uniref:NACHT domain-containing protein n=1 Tax=Rhizoctonia solani TaxID=456999 RepID=A0A8H3GRL7_9AGAM|nr:unnamed protein product [Rhizoctonia solani]
MSTQPQPSDTRSKPKPRGLRRWWDKTREFIGGSPSHEAQHAQTKNTVTPWDTLRAALRGLESSAEVFPPLKAAITEITISLDLVQRVAKKHPEYDQLAHEFEGIARTLEQCIGEFGPEDRSGNVEYITKALVDQISHVNKKRAAEKNILSKIAEAQDLQDDVIKCHNEAVILFQNLQCEVSLRASRRSSLQRMRELLKEMSPVDEARYNSSYAMVARRRSCTKGTRVVVQEEVHQWAQTPKSAKIYWMNGMAGTGKTTIAYTLCEWLAQNQLLGANFFCSRTSTLCSSGRQIIPTIANQLAHYSHAFRSELCRVLDEDASVFSLDVERQFKRLILQPIIEVNSAIPAGVVVVVDALDECQESYIVKEILKLLLSSSVNMPIKFFVTSRPEPAIRGSMVAEINYPPSVLHLHDIQDTIVQGDIKLYLEESFSGMSPPPSEDEVKQLVARSGKLFIYAATVARYVMPERASVDPSARLKKVLAAGRGDSSNGSQIKLKELDDLYMVILLGAFDEQLENDERDEMKLVLQTVLCAREPMTLKTLEPILGPGCTQNKLRYYLEPLRSVLHVSEEGLISTFHASFPDFMFDKDRSSEFHCNRMQHNFFLATRCFQVMSEKLHFNMCHLESSTIFDNDVENLEQRITQIDQGLMYSCRYWAEHLREAGSFELEEAHKELMGFLTLRLLFWIEVLSLTKLLMIAKEALSQAQNWLSVNHISDAAPTHVTDAIDFVNYFAGNECSYSTPHLYISALPSFRRSSTVYENNYPRLKGLININGPIITRDRLSHIENHSKIHSAVFSSDGARVISVQGGTGPTLVMIRDALTGLFIADPLELQTRSPTSVALSSDGTYAVAASTDFTITAYDTHTGNIFTGPLQGHTGSIRVWDIRNEALPIGPGEGHTQLVYPCMGYG